MKKIETEKLFNDFKSFKILIIGDVMVDSYITGSVNRISPEAPVPVINKKETYNRLGGAANVALNVKSMGATPLLCSVVGNDQTGIIFQNLLDENNLSSDLIFTIENRKTTSKTRVISHGQQLLRIDDEETYDISEKQATKITQVVEKIISTLKTDAIIIQDYNKGMLTPLMIKNIIRLSENHKIPIFADPKRKNFNLYKRITLFKPNFREFQDGLNVHFEKNDREAILLHSKKYIEKNNIDNLLLTLSEQGIFICNRREFHFIPAHTREIIDVSGAGDTVISLAALCFIAGLEPYHVAFISNLAGGLVCEKTGVTPVEPERLKNEIEKFGI